MFTLCAFADEAYPQLDKQITALTENEITHLEIRGVDGQNISEITAEQAKEARRKLDASGIKVWAIGSPTGKIKIDEPFYTHLESFRHMLELADILGASHYRLFSFYGTSDRSEGIVIQLLSEFLKAAEGSSITLCHENEKGIFGDIADRCVRIHNQLPQIKAVFDPANFVQCNQDTAEAWEMLKPYVEYVHIKDSLSDGSIVPAGKGIGNLEMILSEFSAMGGGTLTIEPHLHVFDGLKDLENDSNESLVGKKYSYPSPRAAFDAACGALKTLI